MSKTFITSDHHFNHTNILRYCPNRNFNSIFEHDEGLISAWNLTVSDEDTVLHLGDFGFNSDYNSTILSRLKGRKILVSGNHDDRNLKHRAFRSHWAEIYEVYKEITHPFNGEQILIVLCHYPLHSFRGAFKGSFHFHGHTHSTPDNPKIPLIQRRKDVGVDSRYDFAPWELNELLTLTVEEDERETTNPYLRNLLQ